MLSNSHSNICDGVIWLEKTLEKGIYGGVGDFELIAYSSRGEIFLFNGVSFILVHYSNKQLQVEMCERNVASFEIYAILL